MSLLTIKKDSFQNFGNTLFISNGDFDMHVTLDFGPRIIYFSKTGKENMFYNDLEHKPLGEKFDIYNGDIIKLYGGHRLWSSPEIMPDCYYPDNFPVEYEVVNNNKEIIFTAPVEKSNNIQKIISITFDNEITLKHTIKNVGNKPINLGLWAITMFDTNGTEILPIPDRSTGYLHNKNFSFWDYTKLNDERLKYGNKFITLKQNPSNNDNFKLGYNNEHGWAAYFNKGQLFIKKFDFELGKNYPDGGCNFETYTSYFMLEMESLSEFYDLQPNEEKSHFEKWSIYESELPETEDEIEKILNKFL